jgi:hypothetical protein
MLLTHWGIAPRCRLGPSGNGTDVAHANDGSGRMCSLGTNSCGVTVHQRRFLCRSAQFRQSPRPAPSYLPGWAGVSFGDGVLCQVPLGPKPEPSARRGADVE